MVISDQLPYMITISRQPGPPRSTFRVVYSLTNQYVGSNKVAFTQPGTKFGHIIMQGLIFLDGRQDGEISEFGNMP